MNEILISFKNDLSRFMGYLYLSHIRDTICFENPNSAYTISSFPPNGNLAAMMITGICAFERREVIMSGRRH